VEYGARSGGAEKVRSANAELGKNPMAVSPAGRIRGVEGSADSEREEGFGV